MTISNRGPELIANCLSSCLPYSLPKGDKLSTNMISICSISFQSFSIRVQIATNICELVLIFLILIYNCHMQVVWDCGAGKTSRGDCWNHMPFVKGQGVVGEGQIAQLGGGCWEHIPIMEGILCISLLHPTHYRLDVWHCRTIFLEAST